MMGPGPDRKRALGRGLDALLPAAQPKPGASPAYGDKSVFSCPIERIVPQPGQPRQHFDEEELSELEASIREHGIIEPLADPPRSRQDRATATSARALRDLDDWAAPAVAAC